MLEVARIRRQHMHDITALFADALAAKLGDSAAKIRDRGLDAGAFRGDHEVHVTLADGSTMHLRYAFFVEDESTNLLAVFSEHGGYHFFVRDELRVEQLVAGVITVSRVWPA